MYLNSGKVTNQQRSDLFVRGRRVVIKQTEEKPSQFGHSPFKKPKGSAESGFTHEPLPETSLTDQESSRGMFYC